MSRVTGRLQDIELQDMLAGDVVPHDLLQPDWSKTQDELIYRPKDWEDPGDNPSNQE